MASLGEIKEEMSGSSAKRRKIVYDFFFIVRSYFKERALATDVVLMVEWWSRKKTIANMFVMSLRYSRVVNQIKTA